MILATPNHHEQTCDSLLSHLTIPGQGSAADQNDIRGRRVEPLRIRILLCQSQSGEDRPDDQQLHLAMPT